jgi:hypothetical protein
MAADTHIDITCGTMATAIISGEAVPPYEKKKTVAVSMRSERTTVARWRDGDGWERRSRSRVKADTSVVAPITAKITGVAAYILPNPLRADRFIIYVQQDASFM